MTPSDTDALRFLWWPGSIEDRSEDYKMLVRIFGAKSSPCCANNRELTNRRLLSRRRLLVTSCLRSASRTIWRQNLITIPGRRLARSFLLRCLCLCWKNVIHITVRETTREMSNLRETRNCIAYAYRKGFINDREFVLLYDANRSKNPDFPYWNYERFEPDELTNAECNAEFRFYKHDIQTCGCTSVARRVRDIQRFDCRICACSMYLPQKIFISLPL